MSDLLTPCCNTAPVPIIENYGDDFRGFECIDCRCEWDTRGNPQITCADHIDVVAHDIFPNGCGACGRSERGHAMTWMSGIGIHTYLRPTDAQRKQRMLKRRLASTPSV